MYEIEYYKDKNGYSQIAEWIEELKKGYSNNKNKRVQLKQFITKINYIEELGTRGNKDTIKHIVEDIWEIRPGDNRVLLFTYINDKIILLHQFRKEGQKTPKQEIERAKRERNDWIERNGL